MRLLIVVYSRPSHSHHAKYNKTNPNPSHQDATPDTCRSKRSLSGNEAHVDPPAHTRQRADEVPALDGLDSGEVDEADDGPELPPGNDDGPKLGLGGLPDELPVDAGQVDGARGGPEGDGLEDVCDAGRGVKGGAQGVRVGAEEEGVEEGAEGLVEEELDCCVGDGERGVSWSGRGRGVV